MTRVSGVGQLLLLLMHAHDTPDPQPPYHDHKPLARGGQLSFEHVLVNTAHLQQVCVCDVQ